MQTVTERAIIAEAVSRGWKVFHLPGAEQFYRIDHPLGKKIWFRESLPQTSSFIGNRLTRSKIWTNSFIESLGYRLPAALELTDESQVDQFLQAHRSLVVKPAYGDQGRGVTVGVRNKRMLRTAIAEARRVGSTVMLQETLTGNEYRLLVIGHTLFAAAKRLPVTLRGDGVSSLKLLVEQANTVRQATSLVRGIPLEKVAERYTAEEWKRIPQSGEEVVFSWLSSASLGGEAEDVTDAVHPSYRRAAETIARAFDLTICGFDLVTDDISAPYPSVFPLLELNSMPGFIPHLYPSQGQPRNPAIALLDYLFANPAE